MLLWFTQAAYIRAFLHTNPRILLCILFFRMWSNSDSCFLPYVLFMKRTHVYMRFYWDQLSYRSIKVNFAEQTRSINLTQIYSFSLADLRQFFIISSVDHTKASSYSKLEILNHHYIHGCIIDSDLSIKDRVHPCRYSLEKFIH